MTIITKFIFAPRRQYGAHKFFSGIALSDMIIVRVLFSRKRKRIMGKNKILTIALVLVMVCTSGCYYYEQNSRLKCVETMNEMFPDDHFEYLEQVYSDIDSESSDFYVSSQKFPDKKIRVNVSGKNITSNYNLKRYEKEIEEYFHNFFDRWYGNRCDFFEVTYRPLDNDMTPLANMTAEEYIDTYVTCKCVSLYLFSAEEYYLSEADNQEILVNICRDRNEPCRIDLQWYSEKTEDWDIYDFHIEYTLDMKDKDTITYMYVRYQDYTGASRQLLDDLAIR